MNLIIINKEIKFLKSFSSENVRDFAGISEDNNPLHLDEEYASKTIFKKPVVHGVLLIGMFSKIFGTIYPGNGGIYLSQTAKFLKPAFIGDEITAKVKLVDFDEPKYRGIFKTECFDSKGNLLVVGEAKILFPKSFQLVKE